jgi:quercetin dioxygenase-like cupin family protein
MPNTHIDRPPHSFRPDRPETMSESGERPPNLLAAGVSLDCPVGTHNGARDLTTGELSVAPLAQLPHYVRSTSESITVLSGAALVIVEDREYSLAPLDNIVIPRGIPHAIRNPKSSTQTYLHIALPCSSPELEHVSTVFGARRQPDTFSGIPGRERLTRFETAQRSAAGPGTSFIDYFNQTLTPGIEMSGGYGAFEHGGRLPAHLHDFDESICIIQGVATCVVEGRRYEMASGRTALQPRGRVHYFINDSLTPMAMLWVYAGPEPERIVVDERLATGECVAWD